MYSVFAGDFNGDGKVDLFAYNGDAEWTMCLSRATSFNCITGVIGPNGPNTTSGNDTRTLIADLNGDGRADIILHNTDNDGDINWIPCISDFGPDGSTNSNTFSCPASGTTVPATGGPLNKIAIFDFNGDGLADMASGSSSTGDWQIALSVGDGTFVRQTWHGPHADASQVVFGDLNGDGRTDIAYYDSNTSKWQVCLSTGAEFSCTSGASNWLSQANPINGVRDIVTGDFNGDGRTDFAVHQSGSNWGVGYANGPVGDLVTQIENGLHAKIQIDYKPLTDSSVYSKSGTTANSNEVVNQSPLYVVSQTRASTTSPATPWFQANYSYNGLKGDTTGRGVLG